MGISHTPGPWRVEQGTTLVWGNCNPDDRSTYGMGYPVASLEKPRHWSGSGAPTIDTQEANARLIAAAPELLEALEEIAHGEDLTREDCRQIALRCSQVSKRGRYCA